MKVVIFFKIPYEVKMKAKTGRFRPILAFFEGALNIKFLDYFKTSLTLLLPIYGQPKGQHGGEVHGLWPPNLLHVLDNPGGCG